MSAALAQSTQIIYQQQQQQQQHQSQAQSQAQQQFSHSSPPLSNSSSNSSSCLTTSSFTSSSYSPLQLNTPNGQIMYATIPSHQQTTIMPGQMIPLSMLPGQISQSKTSTNTTNTPVSASTENLGSAGGETTIGAGGSIYSYNALGSTSGKSEAKKAKTQRSQPSKVVHIRNIPQQITEIEIIQFGLIFGNIENVLNLRSKCQAFLEFEKCEEAQSMINYFVNNPISVAGRQIFVQYSNYKNLVTDPSNTNNQVARAALDLAKDLHKAAQTGGQNTVLRAMIQNMLYSVSLDTIYQIFNRYGPVLKIITFTKNDKFQALIQMKDAASAQAAKNTLHGQNIYNSCCTLHIDYSKLNTLNVKYNNEKSRDYTNPLLPAGDCPESFALGAGGMLNPSQSIQLSMAAAAAAAGFCSPFAATGGLPAGYHMAPAGNPFINYGKYISKKTDIF
jgi:RNA recognition motif-containing protein